MNNPYVNKFSKAFNLGLAVVVFVLLAVIASCVPQPAHAQSSQGSIPATCFPNSALYSEIKAGELKPIIIDKVMIKVHDEYLEVQRFVLQSSNGNIATVLQDTDGSSCVVFVQVKPKKDSNNL